jgi:hypothetical protein
MALDWPLERFQTEPPFAGLASILSAWSHFPDLAMLNAHGLDMFTHSEKPVQFCLPEILQEAYEVEIYQTGWVATRPDSWHDLFNALIWFTFPKLKAALNAQHLEILAHHQTGSVRHRGRDKITLLDESGVLLPYSNPRCLQALLSHEWEWLFLSADWGQEISAMIFGHANFEKALNPYIGWTGKAWPIAVPADFFTLSRQAQEAFLDNILAGMPLPERFFPLPMLGIPGWHEGQTPAFYRDTGYFRPKRGF